MKKLLTLSLTLLFAIGVFDFALPNTAPDADKVIFEITDKFNEVRFGLTESTIYMVFSERIRGIANKTFMFQHQLDTHAFEDSEGNFISGNALNLESNKIELERSNISEISFKNGKMSFTYQTNPKVGFEDIYSYNGTKAIENFYLEDLEAFILTFSSK